jgi:regulatory protein
VRGTCPSTRIVQDPALKQAYRLLAYRSRSEQEMRERLGMKGFSRDDIDQAIIHLKSSGLLDDGRLAHDLVRQAEETRGLGLMGTRRFLLHRGVPPQLIDEAIREMDEAGTAKKLVARKMRAWSRSIRPGHPFLKKRLYSYFSRRGYAPETIRKAIEENTAEEETP